MNKQLEKVAEKFPTVIGDLAIQTCLAGFPVALLVYNLFSTLGKEHISIQNEESVKQLLCNLQNQLDRLEQDHGLVKESLRTKPAYQEVAHKKLLSISALSTEEDLRVSAQLIAICALLSIQDSRDKLLVRAISEITAEEVKTLTLVNLTIKDFERRKDLLTDDERRDAVSYGNLEHIVAHEFSTSANRLLRLSDLTPIISRLHTLGLLDAQKSGMTTYGKIPDVYPPKLTTVGSYLCQKLDLVSEKTKIEI